MYFVSIIIDCVGEPFWTAAVLSVKKLGILMLMWVSLVILSMVNSVQIVGLT